MTSPGHGDLGGMESGTFDFSQLEDYINDESEGNIYFHDALVTSSEIRVPPSNDRPHGPPRSKDIPSPASTLTTSSNGGPPSRVAHGCVAPSEAHQPKSSFGRGGDSGTPFNKPHNLPDSPPDSGSEPPFSPPIEDLKLRCPSIDMLHHQHHLADVSASHPSEDALKHQYLGFVLPQKHIPDSSSCTASPPSSSTSPHHNHGGNRHHSPVPASPVPVHSTHSVSMPILTSSANPLTAGQLIAQIPQTLLSPYVGNTLQQQMIPNPAGNMTHIYTGEEFLYDNLSSPVTSTTTVSKKRKLPDSPKPRGNHHGGVQVKTEPSAPSPDPSTTMLPSSEDDYSFDLSNADPSALFVDSSYQCIRFQAFQQSTWAQLLDKDMKDIPSPQFRVDADKGFNFSNADESFVCQKKNHFQVTVHVQPLADARYVRAPEGGVPRPIEKFALHFHGVKMESPTQLIKVEQSQSDRSKRPFHPVPLELVVDQVTKTTVGRLHFSETTSNNMRKKGKPNPDQRFFYLVVSLCAHVTGDVHPFVTVIAHSSEKIIVRASNPGQFENDMELSWQKGHTMDSIFHNGRVGINTDRPEEALVVHGNIKVTGHILQPSDFRAKYDICELDTREQLRNVANLRIVRYRYLPEFENRLGTGVGNTPDTGVIAQEVRDVIPEAVTEAGDLVLNNGNFIENLLVVNKERIFMENVGAVKELCKVTDNLETRIDELERINKKLTSIKRKDSFKSTSTDLSRVSSGKHRRCRHACDKRRPGHSSPLTSCSSHFIQSTIVILVIIMACCLLALATLYIMEYQTRSDKLFRSPLVINIGSSSYRNSTSPLQEKYTVLSTLFPTVSWTRIVTHRETKATPTGTSSGPKTTSSRPTTWTVTTSTSDPFSFSVESDCQAEECPVYCCDPFLEDDDLLPLGQEDDGHQHVDRKRSENVSILDDLKSSQSKSSSSSAEKSLNLTDRKSSTESKPKIHKLIKRLTSSEDTVDSNNVFVSDDRTRPLLHLLELNVTLFPEVCSKERLEGSVAEEIVCTVHISRYFPLSNVTLHVTNEEPDTAVQYCSSKHFASCPGSQKPHSGISKRESLPEDHMWQLPVGFYFQSTFRFRIMVGIFSTDENLCSSNPDRPFTEYVIQFQRRCDK